MGLFQDIAKAGYGAARAAGKIGSVSSDIGNVLNGNIDKVAKKQMKRAAFKNLNKAMNAGIRQFRL